MKVKLFTHTDLDGVGCAIVGKIAYGEEINITYCDYHNVNDIIIDFIVSGHMDDYDKVYITDISVNEEVAERIEFYNGVYEFILLDHHPTAEWLNKYEWATVKPTHMIMKSSGTSLLYEHLIQQGIMERHDNLFRFCEKVRRYDTWEWQTKYNDAHAKQLNDLLYIIGRDEFFERFVNNLDIEFKEYEKLILRIEQDKIDRYIESKEKQITEAKYTDGHTGLQYQFGVVFAEQYHSQLGNVLAANHPEYDFIAIINPGVNKVSYRSVKDDINGNVSLFAKLFDGGGHVKASGSQYIEEINKQFIETIFR